MMAVSKRKQDREMKKLLGQLTMAATLSLGVYQVTTAQELSQQEIDVLTKKAEAGDAEAQFNLSLMYSMGDGVRRDEVKAFEWIEKAATQGYVDAQYVLGIMYKIGLSVRQDEARSIEWLEKSALQGSARAQVSLGDAYDREGVHQDGVKAASWFEKAAMQSNDGAQLSLGWLYSYGQGVRQNKSTAKEWFGKACDLGNQTGCNEYCKLNEQGY